MRFGPRFNVECASIATANDFLLPWVKVCKYLEMHMGIARTFICVFDEYKSKFVRAFNAIFGKIRRIASEEVMVHSILRQSA